jgi:AcrR family transcriptional regulator
MTKRRAPKRTKRPPAALLAEPRDAQRRRVLDAAAKMLAEGGPEALSMRELATAVGVSTKVLYTLFGNRDAIVVALYEETLALLGEEFRKVTTESALGRLIDLAYAYRRFSFAHRHYVHAITLAPGAMGVSGGRVRESVAFSVLRETVDRAIAERVFVAPDPAGCAEILWITLHGFVQLELAGYFPDPATAERRFFETGQAIFRGFFP